MEEKNKFIVVEVPESLHIEVKTRATKRGINMKVWMLQAIWEKILQEKQYE